MKLDDSNSFNALKKTMQSLGEERSYWFFDGVNDSDTQVNYFSLPQEIIKDRPDFVMGRKSENSDILLGVSNWWGQFQDVIAAGQYMNLCHTDSAQNPGILLRELNLAEDLLDSHRFLGYMLDKKSYLDNAVIFADDVLRSFSNDYTKKDITDLKKSARALHKFREDYKANFPKKIR